MKITINQISQQAFTAHQEGKLDQAEGLYRKLLEIEPKLNSIHYNFGILLYSLNRLDEAEASYKKAIELKPDYALAYNNLGITLDKLGRLEDAEASYKKTIELKPDYAIAYNNLGSIYFKLKKTDEAEKNYKKAIELKPDYAEAHTNLKYFIDFKKLLLKINQKKIIKKMNEINPIGINNLRSSNGVISNSFISNREVEAELVSNLYKKKVTELSQMKTGPLFGNGRTSNFQLFEEDHSIIKNLEKDLTKIMCQVVKSEVYISESFFNIMTAGDGSIPHNHLSEYDILYGLTEQKYSLQYYLSAGDQNCTKPGFFEMKDPDEKILPSNGMILMIPAGRTHSAIYNGKTDRVMIGVNFYSII